MPDPPSESAEGSVNRRERSALGIHDRRHRLQVIRIYTSAVTAQVINVEALRQILHEQRPRNSVGSPRAAPDVEATVSVPVCTGGPLPAIGTIYLRPKASSLDAS